MDFFTENVAPWVTLAFIVLCGAYFAFKLFIGLRKKSTTGFDYRRFFQINCWDLIYHVIFFILAILVIKLRLNFSIDEIDNKIMYFNNNSIDYSTIFGISTFLFGIVLTFDMHYYDQIEPKYDNEENAEKIDEDLIYKRVFFLIKMVLITSINTLSTTFNLTWMQLSWYTPTEMLATTFMLNLVMVIWDFLYYQCFQLWFKRIEKDIANK